MIHLLIATVALRPYVFVFLAAFLFIAIISYGLRTTLLFAVMTYVVALACERSSIHNGFPFGLYHYIGATHGRELWVAGVPFMDSLSFTFLGFASFTVALLANSPLYRRGPDLRLLDTWKLRRSPRVWLMAALFMVMVDLVVDPLSVRGDEWFLGKIFWYDPPGPHFGVPISNYLGWFFVAAIAVGLFQALDGWLNRSGAKTARDTALAAVACAARSAALCRDRNFRHHDAVRHRRERYRMGQHIYFYPVCRADTQYSDAVQQLWRRN